MKYTWLVLVTLLGIIINQETQAQIILSSEYMAPSSFMDEDGEKIGKGKGDLKTISAAMQIPLSVKMNEHNQPTAWSIGLSSTYASMNNRNLSTDYCIDEILNAQLAVIHTRPISEKWSVLGMLGGGIYTGLSDFSGKCILGQGGILFIRKMNPNLSLGGGVAVNNVIGYPMAFFTFYLDWQKNGKLNFNISMINSFEISVSMQVKESLKLRLIGQANGLSAIVDRNGKSKIFVQQYGIVGFQPEFKWGKYISTRITGGISVDREVYYQNRTLKAFYGNMHDDYPHFGITPYFAVAFKDGL